jgi:hypothetical protein
MNTNESARELMTQQRHQQEHRQESMLNRSEEGLKTTENAEVEEEARELMAQQRQKEEHIQESMLERAEAEVQRQ